MFLLGENTYTYCSVTNTAGRHARGRLRFFKFPRREHTHTVGERILRGSVFEGVHIHMLLRSHAHCWAALVAFCPSHIHLLLDGTRFFGRLTCERPHVVAFWVLSHTYCYWTHTLESAQGGATFLCFSDEKTYT